MKLNIKIAQLIVERSCQKNLKKMLTILESAQRDEWVIFPEGMLSGYFPEDDQFMQHLDQTEIHTGIDVIREVTSKKQCNCIFGTITFEKSKLFNICVIYYEGKQLKYKKNNMSLLDKKWFQIGRKLDVYSAKDCKFGVQMCRELSFPEQWKVLKHKGAEVVFHINNSVQPYDGVRKNVLISRAFENQFFVCSVNNTAFPQTLQSLIIGPLGEVIYESKPQREEVVSTSIDLDEVRNNFLSQERSDLVKLCF